MDPRRAHWIERLFPIGIVVCELDESLPAPALPAEEAAFVAQAVEKRRAEFARGRSCARAACATLGVSGQIIPVGQRRAPIWPASLVGSITHCRGLVDGQGIKDYHQVHAACSQGLGAKTYHTSHRNAPGDITSSCQNFSPWQKVEKKARWRETS